MDKITNQVFDYPDFMQLLDKCSNKQGKLENIEISDVIVKNIPREIKVFSYKQKRRAYFPFIKIVVMNKFFGKELVRNIIIKDSIFTDKDSRL